MHVEDEGLELVFGVSENQHLSVAYYRNSAIHVLNGALSELTILCAAAQRARSPLLGQLEPGYGAGLN